MSGPPMIYTFHWPEALSPLLELSNGGSLSFAGSQLSILTDTDRSTWAGYFSDIGLWSTL